MGSSQRQNSDAEEIGFISAADGHFNSYPIHAVKHAVGIPKSDLFVKISDTNFSHAFQKGTPIDRLRLVQYIANGITEIFVRHEDAHALDEYVSQTVEKILQNPDCSVENKIDVISMQTEYALLEVFNQVQVIPKLAENAKTVIENYTKTLISNPKTASLLVKLVLQGDYHFYHAISCSVLSMFLAKATGLFDKRMIEVIGLGGLLHDIGEVAVDPSVIKTSGSLSPVQWLDVRTHTKLGLRMIESMPTIPDEVRYIVYQHHEAPNGSGYPNGLKGDMIFYPAKIVGLVDGFSALVNKRPYRPAFSINQAIHILESEKGKYDLDLLRLLKAILLKTTRSNTGLSAVV